MNNTITGTFVLALSSLLVGCDTEQTANSTPPTEQPKTASAPVDKAALVEEAKDAVMALGGPLKAQLQTAMQSAGPAQAVAICQQIAPALAESVSAEKGVAITRVSLRNRNPDMGAPNAWQTAVLEDFEARKQAGEAPATLSYAEVVDDQFRFMKAVPTAEVCLKCHGQALAPEVTAKLAELYPEDKATGFMPGDIRGAFVVVKQLTP